ncbi:MAG: hypothetical protein C0418_05270 [Coriobacteriaceae bacterium]|nr:hypothetical protein [Coriobacteriaceae bacterium]
MARSDRTRRAMKSDARAYLAKAEQFLAGMEAELAEERWDAAGLAAIHAGISAGDAVLGYHGGVRSIAQDHRATVDLLKRTMGSAADGAAKHLKRLIDKKNLVEYEQRRLTASEAADLAEQARRFLGWAREQLPRTTSG